MNHILCRTSSNFLRSSAWTRATVTALQFPMQHKSTFNFPSAADFVNRMPKPVQPYLRLSRFDKPIGSWLLFLPGAWSIAFAGLSMNTIELTGLFALGSILMRGAGCTINDLWDKNYDRLVERTKSRPIASGAITPMEAVAWTGVQLSLSFIILMQLNLPSIILGVVSLIPVVIYPLMKRFTYWPQLFLGLTFNWGTLMGLTAATGVVFPSVILPLYFAGIAWTLHYDTIYAHQDKSDDLLIGVKSTALRLGSDTKMWLRAFSIVMLSHLVTAGCAVDQSLLYFVGLGGVGYHLHRQIESVDLNRTDSCWKAFSSNRTTGLMILATILVGNFFK